MFLFCAICGGLIRHKQRWPVLAPELRWQTKVVLLYDPALEFETLEHHYHAGKLKDAPRLDFRREGPDQDIQKVRAIRADSHSNEFILLGSECHDDGAVAAAANDDNPGGGSSELTQAGPLGPGPGPGPGSTGIETANVKVNVKVQANTHVGRNRFGGDWSPMPYYISVHEACLDIAERVAARPRHGVYVQSLRTLWKVLRMRFDAADNEVMADGEMNVRGYVFMRYHYFTANLFINEEGGSGSDERWDMVDPTHVPDLTDIRLGHLVAHEERYIKDRIQDFHKRFLALPQELQDHITSFLDTTTPLPNHLTRLLPGEYWRHILVYGRQLPFLWDLDVAAIEKADPNRDWEHLVRVLSLPFERCYDGSPPILARVYTYHDLNVSDRLRNRRRIWQLVEEMFVGDVLPVSKRPWDPALSPPTMPRYWDEYGEPVYPIVRVPGIGGFPH